MKTIDETAKEVTHEWHKLSWMTRFNHNGEPPSFDQLAKAGIVAGLRMAAEVCDEHPRDIENYDPAYRNGAIVMAGTLNAEILNLIPTPAESAERGEHNEH